MSISTINIIIKASNDLDELGFAKMADTLQDIAIKIAYAEPDENIDQQLTGLQQRMDRTEDTLDRLNKEDVPNTKEDLTLLQKQRDQLVRLKSQQSQLDHTKNTATLQTLPTGQMLNTSPAGATKTPWNTVV